MNFRTITLAMLSLALVATLVGTLVGLFLNSEEAWRLAGSALILTVMSGAWAVATRAGEARATPVVLAIVIGSGCAACFFIASVWMPWGWSFESCLASGASFLGATAASSASLRAMVWPQCRSASRVALGLQGGALLAWLAASWRFPFMLDDGFRGWILMGASPLAFMVCFGDEADRNSRGWRWSGLAALGVAVLLVLEGANEFQTPWNLTAQARMALDRQGALAVLFATVALAIGMGRLARHAKGGRVARGLHLGTIGLVLFEGGLLAAQIVGWKQGDAVERVLVAFPAMIVSGAAISVVLDRMARAVVAVSVADLKEALVECPRCRHRQRLPTDGERHECTHCRLGIAVTLTQRVCFACSYDLAGSGGAVSCPECGAPVVTQAAHGSA